MQHPPPIALEAASYTATATLMAASIAGLIALCAAILSLTSSLINTRVNKRNAGLQTRILQQIKHADFRQIWINTLRDSFIDFEMKAISAPPNGPASAELMGSASRILLMMNKDDANYAEMKAGLFIIIENTAREDRRVYFGQDSTFIAVAQKSLKAEWDTTKADLYRVPKDYSLN